MKNLFFIAMLFWCISAYSQHWNYGIEVGYTNNKFRTKGLDSNPQSGFKVGGIIDYNFKSNILIETGIAYERKGGKLEGNNLASQKISKIEVSHADYLNIPVSVGYKVDIKNKISFIPQIGWFLNIGVQGSGQLSGIDNYNQPYTMGIDIFSAPSISQYRSIFFIFYVCGCRGFHSTDLDKVPCPGCAGFFGKIPQPRRG